ncbi:MAG: hypothetical protein KIT27_05025 [Legionellales bacterium]|nr:hypothetical protein [Legionellales bacterium]
MTNLILMIGYITFKISLSAYLDHDGYSLNQAYSLATTSLSLFAICCVIWGYLNRNIEQRKIFILTSLFILAISYLFILSSIEKIQLLGITFFVIGGSLYSTNITLLVNEQFDDVALRHQGNQAMQWALNFGCLFGVFGLSMAPTYITFKSLYLFSGIFVVCSFIFLYFFKKNIQESHARKLTIKNHFSLIIKLAWLSTLVCVLLNLPSLTRLLSIMLFIACVIYVLFLSFKEKNQKYFQFVIILILCIFVYWLSFSIFSSQFAIFLTSHVENKIMGITVSPLIPLIFDPLANLICGGVIYYIYKLNAIKETKMLIASLFLNFLAFMLLFMSIKLLSSNNKIEIFWPIVCIFLYATSEFLLITTTQAQISTLIEDKKRQGLFVGVQRLCAAFSATVAYYLIHHTNSNVGFGLKNILSSKNLYCSVMVISLIALFLLILFRKIGIFKL